MAYTNIIPVHRLDNALHYVMDEAKTSQPKLEVSLEDAIGEALNKGNSQQELFVDAIGCTCETAFEDMCQIKKMWHKEKGVQGFHLIQSFAPGEVSPQLAHKIGMELAQELSFLGNLPPVLHFPQAVRSHSTRGSVRWKS